MMKDSNAELYQTAATVFEEVGFMFLAAEKDSNEEPPMEAAVSVDFSGTPSGTLVIAAYGKILPTLAANMLGEDEPPSAEQQQDALKEAANIVCGNVLPRIYGKANVFRLQAPKVINKEEASEYLDRDSFAKATLCLEEGLVKLVLCTGE